MSARYSSYSVISLICMSDLPACGPRAVCDCSTPLFVNCSSRGLSSVPANLSRELIVL